MGSTTDVKTATTTRTSSPASASTTSAVATPLYYTFTVPQPQQHQPQQQQTQQQPTLHEVGGKALSLIELNNTTTTTTNQPPFITIPKGLVLTTSFFDSWNRIIQQSDEWKAFVDAVVVVADGKDGNTGDNAAAGSNNSKHLKQCCDDIINKACQSLTLTAQQQTTLDQAVQEVFGVDNNDNDNTTLLVSVRSSSPEEDLATASFAGGYHTTLGVPLNLNNDRSKQQQQQQQQQRRLHQAIIDSYASMYDAVVVSYKRRQQQVHHHQEHDENDDSAVVVGAAATTTTTMPSIAIILQQQIDAQTSGVAFSINPQNNCYDEITIAANFGLGESVVSGTVTPDHYIVENTNSTNATNTTATTTTSSYKILSKQVANKEDAVWLTRENHAAGSNDSGNGEHDVSTTRSKKNDDPTKPALTDDQIMEVARLVAHVEEVKQKNKKNTTEETNVVCEPIDIEWAYDSNGKLYLLQARPITTYIPLFPELVTPRGAERNLYLDVIVMSQGFSDPMSVLGMDVWGDMLRRIKPAFSVEGQEGTVCHVGGREYIHLSNFMKSTGGRKQVDAAFRAYDKALDRALNSIDLDDYTPSRTPAGIHGLLWKQLSQLFAMVPSMVYGLYKGEGALDGYLEQTEELIKICHDDTFMADAPFDQVVSSVMDQFMATIPMLGCMLGAMTSRWRLHKMLTTKKAVDGDGEDADGESVEDLLISLCMDLKGNPTSEMGHAMVDLASFPEVQQCDNGRQFVERLVRSRNTTGTATAAEPPFSEEFLTAYDDYMRRFGCRGVKEIDIASSRTYEDHAQFFSRLRQICIDNNAIINVASRRQVAYEKLLSKAQAVGKESAFIHHASVIQNLLGYREHPKYIIVMIVDMLRRRALRIGEQLVPEQRLTTPGQIFQLRCEEIAMAQKDKELDVFALVEANMQPYKRVEHVKNWPVLIDSRGKIIRAETRGKQGNDATANGVFVGDPISPGVVKGKAKVFVEGPYEKTLDRGEILVARFTEPSWTPIFINAGGVVMEIGGPMQHGSIIAREYGIPCVSGIDDATHAIKDGDMIEVDGSAGTIKLIAPTASDSS